MANFKVGDKVYFPSDSSIIEGTIREVSEDGEGVVVENIIRKTSSRIHCGSHCIKHLPVEKPKIYCPYLENLNKNE